MNELNMKGIDHLGKRLLGLSLVSAVSTIGLLAGSNARAAEEEVVGLEEIVVTARKTEEKLQDIPVTVVAFSEEALQKTNALKLTDLNDLTPGMNFQDGTGRGGPGRFFVRGLTGGVAGTARASTFLDGVYVANSVTNILFGEMERVEVLLGPQSAQFGRSTFGGALNFVTKTPKDHWSGSAAASLATDGEQNFDGFIGGPLVGNTLLGSVYFGSQEYGGPSRWQNPPDTLHPGGLHLGGTSTQMGSVKLVFTPNEDLKVTGRWSYTKDHDEPAFSNILGPKYRTAAYAQQRQTLASSAACTGQPTIGTGPSAYCFVPTTAYYFSGTIDAGSQFKGGFPDGVVNLDRELDPAYKNVTQRATVDIVYSMGEDTLRLTVSRNTESQEHGNFTDSDFTYFPSSRFAPSSQNITDGQVELRYTSDPTQKFHYAVGGYYLDVSTKLDAINYGDYVCTTVCTINDPAYMFETDLPLTGFTGGLTSASAPNRAVSPFNTRNAVRDKSYFAALFYDFTDKWSASAEMRVQNEYIKNRNLNALSLPYLASFNSFLPRYNLQYKITPDMQVYALYSKGNNPGGINTASQLGLPGTGTSESQRFIKEEILNNYEVGFKSLWLNRRLKLNGSVYHMIWDNLQNTATYVDPNGVFFGVTENRGQAKIDGVSLEVEFAPTKAWDFRGTANYVNARYVKFCSTQLANLLYGPTLGGANTLTGADPRCLAAGSGGQFNTRAVLVSGKKLETSPPLMASIAAEYHQEVFGNWELTPRANLQYQDGMWESEMNLAKSPSSLMLELGLGLDKDNMSFEVFCRNCTDEDAPIRTTRLTDPRTSSADVTAGGLGYNQTVGNNPRRPRQFGARASYKF